MILCSSVCMLVSFCSQFENIHVMNFGLKPSKSLNKVRTTYMQCLELASYGMARLCFIVPQPSQLLLRLRIDRCTKKVVTISGTKYATVTHKVLLNTAVFALSNNNNIIIF